MLLFRICFLCLFCAFVFSTDPTQALANDHHMGKIIFIPGGPFIMGSDREQKEAGYQLDEKEYGHSRTREWGWYEDEVEPITLELADFWILETPVTNEAYAQFIAEIGYTVPDVNPDLWESYNLIHPFERTRRHAWTEGVYPKNRARHPVVMVSKADAQAYAQWLSDKTGITWRLPSEAEWEKAARGTDGAWFPWGSQYDATLLNSHDNGPFDTMPVGSFAEGASPFGVLDMAGQVFEWTDTLSPKPNRTMVKGGSWDDRGCGICRGAARHSRPDDIKHILVGFRLVTDENPASLTIQ